MSGQEATTIRVNQVLLLHDPKGAELFGDALWAACQEISAFYGVDAAGIDVPQTTGTLPSRLVRLDFDPIYVGAAFGEEWEVEVDDPRGRQIAELLRALRPILSVDPYAQNLPSYALYQSEVNQGPSGAPRTVPASLLGGALQTALGEAGWMLAITDFELTPPPSWRYIIWDVISGGDGGPGGAVVSIAPLDPLYWREPDSTTGQRVELIKRRARAAAMSVVGSLLGLQRCENERCFLYVDVDSLYRLDDMVSVGPEHGIPELNGRTFARAMDPTEVERIVVRAVA